MDADYRSKYLTFIEASPQEESSKMEWGEVFNDRTKEETIYCEIQEGSGGSGYKTGLYCC